MGYSLMLVWDDEMDLGERCYYRLAAPRLPLKGDVMSRAADERRAQTICQTHDL